MGEAPVRVAQVITRMILGGAQESTLYVCQALRETGRWEPILITGPPIGPEGELLTEAERRGVPYHVVPQMRRQINPWRDWQAFTHLTALLRKLRPTIVHTHSSKAGILGRFAGHVARVPLVLHTIRGLPFHPYAPACQNAVFILAERLADLVTDHFTCVAHAMIDGAMAVGIGPRERFTVIRSGIETAAYEGAERHRERVRQRYGFDPDDVVIGKIARLFDLKGHRFLLKAAPQIVEACPHAKFLFVGEGILREELLATAERLGVRDRLVLSGLVPPTEIPAMISAMDLLVHASLREGLARVLIQALLMERPVVTFALDGAPEVIIDGETGRLVEPESASGLADAVVWTVRNYYRAVQMAREGKRRFAEQFSIRAAARDTERLYNRLLSERLRVRRR
ncbi:MAG: glycosyltransferase family 4 protein [Ectothiorhodospiraceae bacterium]